MPIKKRKRAKKANIQLWDKIDGISQTALESVAKEAGVDIKEWDNFDSIKAVTELLAREIEEKFGVEIPFVDVNY